MKYDDASWHYGGDFPDDLPKSAGGTHIGMFVAWALINGLAGDFYEKELAKLKNREITPGAWFMEISGEKFVDQDLNETGNAFAVSYYGEPNNTYAYDYGAVFDEAETHYHVPDTWDSYDRIAQVISGRFEDWQNPPPPKQGLLRRLFGKKYSN